MNAIVLHGTVNPDGSLEMDRIVQLPPGPVQITIQPAPLMQGKQDWWQCLQDARATLEKRGAGFRTREEIEQERDSFRVEKYDGTPTRGLGDVPVSVTFFVAFDTPSIPEKELIF